jgi:two-component system, LytTR family, response regulator
MQIRTAIIDDEPLARQRMKALVEKHQDIEIIGEFTSALEAKAAVETRSPDLLLLDVQLPRLNGLKLAQLLAEAALPLVVFVTAQESFAVEAFDTRAVDYLLKPVRPERLARALDRVRDQLEAIREPKPTFTIPEAAGLAKPALSRLMAKSGDRVVFIKAADINWIEAAGNYVVVHVGTERHIVRETMTQLENELSTKDFVRLNRSLIVNVRSIAELKTHGQGEYFVTLMDGKRAGVTIGLRELETRLRFG